MIYEFSISGGRPLSGHVNISGCKYSALLFIASSILHDTGITIYNVPISEDIESFCSALIDAGANCNKTIEGDYPFQSWVIRIEFLKVLNDKLLLNQSFKINNGLLFICALLSRPECLDSIRQYLKIEQNQDFLHILLSVLLRFSPLSQKPTLSSSLKECNGYNSCDQINLGYPDAWITANIINAYTTSKRSIFIKNASIEPHILHLIELLNKSGADIAIKDHSSILINGIGKPLPESVYRVSFDRVELGIFAAIAGATNGKITVRGVYDLKSFEIIKRKLIEAGVAIDFDQDNKGITIYRSGKDVLPTSTIAGLFPAFPGALNPYFAVLLCLSSSGLSIIEDTVDSKNFQHYVNIKKMGFKFFTIDRKLFIDRTKKRANYYSGSMESNFDLSFDDIDDAAFYIIIFAASVINRNNKIKFFCYLKKECYIFFDKLKSLGLVSL